MTWSLICLTWDLAADPMDSVWIIMATLGAWLLGPCTKMLFLEFSWSLVHRFVLQVSCKVGWQTVTSDFWFCGFPKCSAVAVLICALILLYCNDAFLAPLLICCWYFCCTSGCYWYMNKTWSALHSCWPASHTNSQVLLWWTHCTIQAYCARVTQPLICLHTLLLMNTTPKYMVLNV